MRRASVFPVRVVLGLILCIGTMSVTRAAGVAHADPQSDYVLHCRGCHGPNGAGAPGAVPPVRGELGNFLGVPGGREFLIRVPGTAQSQLSDARVAALLNWMLREFSPDAISPGFKQFTEDEVTRYRRPPLTDVGAAREKLVRAIEATEGKPEGDRRY